MSRSRTKKKAGQNQGQKPAAPHSPGVQRKDLKASDFYAQNLQRLEVLRGQQKDALRQARQQQLWEQERQKILVEAIATQEELEHILAQQQLLLAKHADTDPQLFSQISAASAASGLNFGNSCLAAATLQHIMQVKAMSVDDWLQIGRAGFPQIAMLLELANRELEARAAPGLAAAGNTAATAASNGNGHLGEDVAAAAVTGMADNTAAAAASNGNRHLGEDAAAGSHEAANSYETGAITAQLYSNAGLMIEKVVTDTATLMYAAMYHNPQPYYHYAALNHATGALQMAPASLQLAVVQRLQLSPLQALHMRIIATEFARLSRAASKEGGGLAEQVAKLSLAAVLDSSDGADGGGTSNGTSPGNGTSTGNNQSNGESGAAAAGSGLQQRAGTASSKASADDNAAAAAAAAAGEADAAVITDEADGAEPVGTQNQAMRKQLDRYLRHINIHTVVTAVSVGNTLTPRQLATMMGASYPFAPNAHAVAEACLSLDIDMPDKLPTSATAAAALVPSTELAAAASHDNPFEDALQRGWQAEVDEHMILRSKVLQQQLRRWWHKIGAAGCSSEGDSMV